MAVAPRTNASHDDNWVPTLIGVSTSDGKTPVPAEVDPTTGQLQVSSSGGSGGTQYTDGAAAATHPIGTQEVFTNGSGIVTAVSTANPLPITGTISVGSTTDESAFTAGGSTTGPIAGVFNDSVASLTSGQQGTIRATGTRAIHTNLRNNTGTEIGTSTTPLQVSLANTGTNATPVAVSGSLSTTPIADVSPATQNITVQDTGSTTATTNANGQSFRTGTATAGAVATFNLSTWKTAIIEVTGTWTGTLLIEGSRNGTIYYQKAVKQIGTSYIANNFTANFAGTVNVAALSQIAVRSIAVWTGTATIAITESESDNGIYVHNGLTIQDATIQTNKLTIKSASTAPIATDPSVVVALSPNGAQATAALQTTGNTSLSSIVTNTTGIATAANQTTMNSNLTTIVTNTGNGATSANQTNGTQQTKITDGTNIGSILKSDGTAAGQNGQIIAGSYLSVPFTTTTVQAVGTTDAGNYKSVSVQINSQGGSSSVAFQQSNDNSTWVAVPMVSTTVTTGAISTSAAATGMFSASLSSRYFRLNVTGIVSGTTAGTIIFSTNTASQAVLMVSQNNTWTVQPGNSPNTTPWLVDIHATGAALADTTTNPTTSLVGALPEVYNGTTWDRLRAVNATITAGTGVAAAGSVGLGKTANPTAVTDGQYIAHLTDKLGKQVVVGSIRDLKGNQFTTITASTSETTIITAVAATFLDVYGVIVENTSATASKVTFKDSTAGTTQFEVYVPAGDTRGFMLPESGAFKQTTVNNNWTATCGTSVSSIVISVLYVKNL